MTGPDAVTGSASAEAGAEPATSAAVGIDGSGTERARCVLAPNPSPMTLDGTNTWVIAEPGSAEVIVVDPGPDDAGHLRRVLARHRPPRKLIQSPHPVRS